MRLKKSISNMAFFVLLAVFGYEMYNKLVSQIKNSFWASYFSPVEDVFMSEIKKNKMQSNPADLEYLLERLAGVKEIRVIEKKKQLGEK